MADVHFLSLAPPITQSAPQPSPDLIKLCEDILEMAKSGQLQSFAGTGFTCTGDRVSAINCHGESVVDVMGAIVWLQHEFAEIVMGGDV